MYVRRRFWDETRFYSHSRLAIINPLLWACWACQACYCGLPILFGPAQGLLMKYNRNKHLIDARPAQPGRAKCRSILSICCIVVYANSLSGKK